MGPFISCQSGGSRVDDVGGGGGAGNPAAGGTTDVYMSDVSEVEKSSGPTERRPPGGPSADVVVWTGLPPPHESSATTSSLWPAGLRKKRAKRCLCFSFGPSQRALAGDGGREGEQAEQEGGARRGAGAGGGAGGGGGGGATTGGGGGGGAAARVRPAALLRATRSCFSMWTRPPPWRRVTRTLASRGCARCDSSPQRSTSSPRERVVARTALFSRHHKNQTFACCCVISTYHV